MSWKTYENNMSFFTAKSSGNSMLKEMERKMDIINNELVDLKKKIDIIDSN